MAPDTVRAAPGRARSVMLDIFEYRREPLTADTTPADLDALGDEGWALCAIVGGVGFFRRSRADRELKELGDRHAAERAKI